MMTYQEIKDRLSKCEYTLKCIKDGTIKDTDQKTVKKLEILKESLGNQLKEQEAGMVVTKDAGEAEKLAKKGVNVNLKTEGPHQTTYIKVSKKDYKKAMGILDSNIDPTYAKMDVVDDDGAGNVLIYFNFRAKDDGEPGEDPAQFIYDLSMDLEANGISVVDKSHDLDEANLNDPVLMKLRALQSKIAKKKQQKPVSSKHSAILSKLQTKRDQVMRDMEQEAEPEGGPIADKYGDMLNKIDAAIAKAKGTKPKSYDDTFNEGQDNIFTFGYNLDMIQAVVNHLKSNYSEDDYELHIGRGDTHPNAVTLKNPALQKDQDLHDMLNAAEGDEDSDVNENKDISSEHLRVLASKAGKAVVKAVHDSGDEVARAKIKDVYASALSGDSSPEAFTVHIIYKNDSEVSYRFQIIDNTLYLLADNKDIKISDIGFKPSGEPFINTELVRNEISKYFKQMREMTDQEFADAKEADRLANHPEKDKLIAIQQLIAKEKGLKEVDVNEEQPTVFDDKSMDALRNIILKYVEDPDAAEKELDMVDYGGLDAMSPEVIAQLDRDPEFKAWYNKLHSVPNADTDYMKRRRSEKDYQQENALGFSDIEKFGSKAASDIDISVRRDPNYTFGKRPGDDARLRYMYAKKLGYIKEGEYAADKYNVNVFGYQTRYFKICPGAKSFMDRVIAQQNDKENKDEIIRIAKLHDLLFMHEIQALKDPAYAAKVLEKAEYIVKTIKDDVDTLGLDVAEVDYLDNHIEKIKDAASKEVNEESELDKITKAKRLIKQQAPAMNKLPQDDPKRKAFIDKVKQINQKHKDLLDKEDDKISGTGRDQELDEGRGDFDDVLKAIENMANNDDISERDAAAEIVLALADRFQLPVDKNLEDYMEEGESDLYEGTDLHVDRDFQFTRTNSGIQITEKYSGYGADARYIHVPGRLLKRFIAGLAKSSKVFKDTKYQGQDAEDALQEVKVGDTLTKEGSEIVKEKK